MFQDDGVQRCGQGKELCDLLVVFGNDILILSDKHCEYPKHPDPVVSWTRWFKRAVAAGATQIYGAERRIKVFPDRLFLDPECKKRFPYPLPAPGVARIHRIVVAHGASTACKRHFGSGTGSLIVASQVIGQDHVKREGRSNLFTIGQIDPDRGYVHVFDDTTLDVIMRTLDTVADLVLYLSKKEAFLQRMRGVIAAGEEELLAFYLQNIDASGEHDFILPKEMSGVVLEEGHWADFCNHPQRLAQIEANRVSYVWDELIEKFSYHIMTGTQQFTSMAGPHESEIALRFLAAENRTRRRVLAQGLLDVVYKANAAQQFVRIYKSVMPKEPYYVLLSMPSTHANSEDEYRMVRRRMLESYVRVCKHVNPDAKDMVGIAVSPTSEIGCSEDLMYLDAREWTKEDAMDAADLQTRFGILQNVKPIYGKYSEYPKARPSGPPRFVPNGRFPRNAPCGCGSGRKFKHCCLR